MTTVGEILIVKNRAYTITEIEVTSEKYPNIKKHQPNVEFHVILKGLRGALKAGFITDKGVVVLFN